MGSSPERASSQRFGDVLNLQEENIPHVLGARGLKHHKCEIQKGTGWQKERDRQTETDRDRGRKRDLVGILLNEFFSGDVCGGHNRESGCR